LGGWVGAETILLKNLTHHIRKRKCEISFGFFFNFQIGLTPNFLKQTIWLIPEIKQLREYQTHVEKLDQQLK
jgi:hypothetical protein